MNLQPAPLPAKNRNKRMKKDLLFQTGRTLCLILMCFFSTVITYAQVYKTVNVETAGTLSSLLTDEEKNTVTDLTVTGNLNASDFPTMKAMKAIVVIDLSGASIENNTIPDNAFTGNLSIGTLSKVTVPNTIKTIGQLAFAQFGQLFSFNFPADLETIGAGAFGQNSKLTINQLPEKLKSIGKNAFNRSLGFSEIIIPATVTEIADGAFQNCSDLKKVTILSTDSVTIGQSAFMRSGLKTVTLPATLKTLTKYAFRENTSLTDLYCNRVKPLSITSDVFQGTTLANDTLYVPASSIDLYKADAVWSKFGAIVGRYKVKYSVDGMVSDSLYVNPGSLLAVPANPVKKDYTFAGWYGDVAYATAWDFATATITADTTLYAKWETNPIKIPVVTGHQSYDVSSLGFADADILKLVSEDKSDSTVAVISNGRIQFYALEAANYTLTKKSTVAESTVSTISPSADTSQGAASTGNFGGVNNFGQYMGENDSTGNVNRPLTGLTHFVGIETSQTGNVSTSWKVANTLAGYNWYGSAPSTRGACYLVAEDRDETTGKLLASVYFDPTITHVAPEALMGPHSYNIIFNPSDDIISSALGSHSSYSDNIDKQTTALDSVKVFRDATADSMIIANVGFMRAYNTGAKTYTFDIVSISSGKFQPGDVLELKYLLGSYNLNYYHKGNSTVVAESEASAQSQISKDTVDVDGYVKFNMYGGGFFSITKVPAGTTGTGKVFLNNNIQIYPNPVTNVLNISASIDDIQELKLMDITGRTLLSQKSGLTNIYTGNLPQGTYLVQIITSQGILNKQLIKK